MRNDDNDEMVTVQHRLYDNAGLGRPGLQYLVAAPGQRIKRSTYERLLAQGAATEASAAIDPKEPEPPAPTLADLTRAELMVKLNEAGIEFDARAKHADLVDILGAAGV